ncbi:unnamed protein product [Vitrella brassicaformis CCMP3155]|uniref:Uncharacterized protein n=1 Tax=Vitrella brassicaformis (strain CCMP3155) TaxID=1169540 RepID=A0A0G4GPW7_VITBC|nr:unnamed protein product [Vitrella brassicaformis CCMP3155]|eukprot:CEM32411.1 unnamed protein product [Vitrella brassicaformis CCMP3155]
MRQLGKIGTQVSVPRLICDAPPMARCDSHRRRRRLSLLRFCIGLFLVLGLASGEVDGRPAPTGTSTVEDQCDKPCRCDPSHPLAAASRQLQVAETTDGLTRDVADGVSAETDMLHQCSDWFRVSADTPAISTSTSPQRDHAISPVAKLQLLHSYRPFGVGRPFGVERVMPRTSMRGLAGFSAANKTNGTVGIINEDCMVCEDDARGPLREFIRSLNIEMRGGAAAAVFRVCDLPFIVCIRFRTGRKGPSTRGAMGEWVGGGDGMVDGYIMVLDADHLIFPPGGVELHASFYDLKGLLGVALWNVPLYGRLSERIGEMTQLRLL